MTPSRVLLSRPGTLLAPPLQIYNNRLMDWIAFNCEANRSDTRIFIVFLLVRLYSVYRPQKVNPVLLKMLSGLSTWRFHSFVTDIVQFSPLFVGALVIHYVQFRHRGCRASHAFCCPVNFVLSYGKSPSSGSSAAAKLTQSAEDEK